MTILTITEARKNLYRLIDETAANHEPIIITGKRGNAVLISESDSLLSKIIIFKKIRLFYIRSFTFKKSKI